MQEDSYLTIKGNSEGLYNEKGSKFIAYAYPVVCVDEVRELLAVLKKDHHDARHHCYAYMLGIDSKEYRVNDDGEPSSTAGKPILGQILSNNITNVFIVVVRYFGGTKLGVSGLINAYKSAAADALANAQIITKTVNDIFRIRFNYPVTNDVMRVVKEERLEQISQKFDLSCNVTLSIKKSKVEKVIERFKKVDGIEIEYLRRE